MAAPHIAALTEVSVNSKIIPVMDFTSDVAKMESVQRNTMIPIAKRSIPRAGILWAEMAYTMELSGSGVVATAWELGNCLKACAMKETVSPGVSVSYTVTGDLVTDVTAVDLESYQGDALQVDCSNSVGDVTFDFLAGDTAKAILGYQGTYTAPTEDATTDALSTFADPVVCKGLVATVDGETVVLEQMVIALNNEIKQRRNLAGTNGISNPKIVDQVPTCFLKFEIPDFSTLNVWNLATTNTRIEVSLVLGTVAGNILTVTVHGYITSPRTVSDGGILMYEMDLDMSWKAADTKLSLLFE